ncbi:MAG: zinc ribbon domain-containing protein [bacterium]|nr:zinc ribbon domain-containing protein [bacterium]
MAKFCRHCGEAIKKGRFCPACGKPLGLTCGNCGALLSEKSRFCPNCGQVVNAAPAPFASQPSPQRSAPAPQRVASAPVRQPSPQRPAPAPQRQAPAPVQPQKQVASLAKSVIMPQVQTLTAAATAGEMDFGELALPGLENVGDGVASAAKVYAPLSGLFHGLGSLAGGAFRVVKKPSSLFGAAILALLWFVLALYRDSDSIIVKFISWLTFSEGGFDRSLPGALCGILGKGTVACAWISLFRGGFKDTIKGIGAFFTGRGEKRGIGSIIFGIALGFTAYFAFAGKFASADAAMAGISGALLSLEALGTGNGKLYELAQSLTSRVQNGTRIALQGRSDGLLTGLSLGFALGTGLSLALRVLFLFLR